MPFASDRLRAQPFTLIMPGGERVQTRLVRGTQVRWRGWGALYDAAGAEAGDVLRYVRREEREFEVSLRRGAGLIRVEERGD